MATASRILEFGDLRVDVECVRVFRGDKEVFLTPTESRLLSCLVIEAGRTVPSQKILEHVWGKEYVGAMHVLYVNIGRLRDKLGDDSREPKFVLTRWREGYQFIRPNKRP